MEDLGHKEPFGRVIRKIIFHGKLAPEQTTLVGSTDGSFNIGLDVRGITFVNYHLHACTIREMSTWWAFGLTLLNLLGKCDHDLRVESLLSYFQLVTIYALK